MLRFLLKLIGKSRDLHPAETGEMEKAYEVEPFGVFSFRPDPIPIYKLRTNIFAEVTDLRIDARTPTGFQRAIGCLKRLDKDWFDTAILHVADEAHLSLEDFGGEPEFWIKRETFINRIQKEPTLEILVEEDECSVSLFLNDGDLFGGHYILLLADEFGNFEDVGVHG